MSPLKPIISAIRKTPTASMIGPTSDSLTLGVLNPYRKGRNDNDEIQELCDGCQYSQEESTKSIASSSRLTRNTIAVCDNAPQRTQTWSPGRISRTIDSRLAFMMLFGRLPDFPGAKR